MKIFLILIISFNCFANETKYIITFDKKLPKEVSYLFPTDKLDKQDLEFLNQLDFYSSLLTRKEVFFILKSEIYKAIADIGANQTPDKIFYEEIIFKRFETVLNSKPDIFTQFILSSVYKDLKTIYNSPDFKTLALGIKNRSENIKGRFAVLRDKLYLLYPWYEKIKDLDPEEIRLFFNGIRIKIINNCIAAIKAQYTLSNNKVVSMPKKDYSPKFITIKKLESETNDSLGSLKNLVDENKSKTNTEMISDWKPKDYPDSFPSYYPQKRPDYTPPKELPMPVNDWKR